MKTQRKNKNMKKGFHILFLIVLLAVALTLLALYYSQPFVSEFNFKDKIAFSDIEVQKGYDYYTNATTLNSASAEVGTLNLKNDGYFKQLYSFPSVVGCIELKDSADQTRVTLRQSQFSVDFQGDGTVYYSGQKTEIISSASRNFVLKAQYTPYGAKISDFTNGNIQAL